MAYDLSPNDAARLASGDEQEPRWTKTPAHELAAHPAPGKSTRRVLLFALFWGCTIFLTAFVMAVGTTTDPPWFTLLCRVQSSKKTFSCSTTVLVATLQWRSAHTPADSKKVGVYDFQR